MSGTEPHQKIIGLAAKVAGKCTQHRAKRHGQQRSEYPHEHRSGGTLQNLLHHTVAALIRAQDQLIRLRDLLGFILELVLLGSSKHIGNRIFRRTQLDDRAGSAFHLISFGGMLQLFMRSPDRGCVRLPDFGIPVMREQPRPHQGGEHDEEAHDPQAGIADVIAPETLPAHGPQRT